MATGLGNLGSAYQPFAVSFYLRVSCAARRWSTCKVEATSDGIHGNECHYRNVVLLRASPDSHRTFLAYQHDHAVEPVDVHASGSSRPEYRSCNQRHRKEVSRGLARRFLTLDARLAKTGLYTQNPPFAASMSDFTKLYQQGRCSRAALAGLNFRGGRRVSNCASAKPSRG